MALKDTLDQINNLDINDIDWSRIGVWPLAGRMVVWIALVIAILIATYFFFVKDLQNRLDRSVATEALLKDTFQQKAYQAAMLEQYQELMATMEENFEFLVSQLPEKTQVPGLLDDIDEKGRDSGLTINSIKLLPEVVADVYVELPIQISVEGTYHDFGTFVSSISGMSRIVTLHDYSITKNKDNPAVLEMEVAAKTYRYKTEDDEDEISER